MQRADFGDALFDRQESGGGVNHSGAWFRGLTRAVQRAIGLRQIHLVGCSRSGTTMIQYSMIAFQDVIITNGETGPDYPEMAPLLGYLREHGSNTGRSVLVTKRTYGWLRPAAVDRLVRRAGRGNLGILHIVRDPRDVLSSTHVNTGRDRAYVSPEWWLASMLAADRVLASVPAACQSLTLRYEDFILAPKEVERKLEAAFALRLRPGVRSIAEVRQNVDSAGYRIAASMIANMNELRDMDARSIGRWRSNGYNLSREVSNPALLSEIESFMAKHDYV
jgi:hypothetical protein